MNVTVDSALDAQQDKLVPGAPPAGPMNVVIQNNRITRITSAGTPGVPRRADHVRTAE